jgi:hypothetical protein
MLDPAKGSIHNERRSGRLHHANNRELDMGTPFDFLKEAMVLKLSDKCQTDIKKYNDCYHLNFDSEWWQYNLKLAHEIKCLM